MYTLMNLATATLEAHHRLRGPHAEPSLDDVGLGTVIVDNVDLKSVILPRLDHFLHRLRAYGVRGGEGRGSSGVLSEDTV